MRQNHLAIPPTAKAIFRGFDLLHPKVRKDFEGLRDHLEYAHRHGHCSSLFRPFETYRHPARQRELYTQRPPVTRADAFESAHQYGLAVDFAAVETMQGKQSFSWAEGHDWEYLRRAAEGFACQCLDRPLEWDRGHIEHALWSVVKNKLR